MKNMNFILEDRLHRDFKKYCVDKNITMTKVLIRLIEKELSLHEEDWIGFWCEISDCFTMFRENIYYYCNKLAEKEDAEE